MKRSTLISRRGILATGASAAFVHVLPCPAISQGKRPLVVQNSGGLFGDLLRENVSEFEKRTGFEVRVVDENDDTILSKLVATRGQSPYDVVSVDSNTAIYAEGMGAWAPDQSSKMSNLGAIYKSCKPPATVNFCQMIAPYQLIYNVNGKLKNPTSWRDLWNDDLIVGVPHPALGYGMSFLYIAAMLNGGSETNLGPGFDAIKRLKKIKIFKNSAQALTLFQQSEIDAGLFFVHRAQILIDQGMPLARMVPKEGTWGQRTGCQIPKLTSNLEGAIAWIDTTLSVPFQAVYAKSLYSPTNRNVVVPPQLAAKLTYGEQNVDSVKEIDWKVIFPQRDAILQRWSHEFGS
jgi:putative spermidine/putrescine transport system substrate-binding protein